MVTVTRHNTPENPDEASAEVPNAGPAVEANVPVAETHAAVALTDTVLPAQAPGVVVDPDDLVDTTKTPTLMDKVHQFRARHEKWEMAVFFFGGFIYDVLTISRIDDTLTLAQNFGYLLVLTGLLLLEQRYPDGVEPPKFLQKVWRWREDGIHFLFGSLLSAFMLLLFKSTSGALPYLFVVGLFALLAANELPLFRKLGPIMRMVLLSLCVTMYFVCLLPVVLGRMGFWVFLLAVAVGCASIFGVMRLIRRWRPDNRYLLRNVAIPGFGVQAALLGLYLVGVIPPLPVAVQFAGIYHQVERVSPGVYHLSSVDSGAWYKPWTWGGPDFLMQPGDKPYYFFRIFAPKHFQSYKVRVRWYFDDPQKGWTTYGNGFMATVSSNGTDGGYRFYATTSNLKPGKWRVVLETEDGHEIHRLNFTAGPDANPGPRVFDIAVSTLKDVKPLALSEWQERAAAAAAKPATAAPKPK
ncbi:MULTISPECIES: DUF2914 domain-containing protein [unclassified Myxococcus]|uniref:DUF2914 domain-containing protein n=1 Tax=Myxococcus TaxID=32 RepID=UPI001144B216|nr:MULTISPECIES: DUF2914 domain-containing protein [unclassified Myxococcus]NOK05953.1 DUF2914 domain-containing protein [Myxococcus xanthus]